MNEPPSLTGTIQPRTNKLAPPIQLEVGSYAYTITVKAASKAFEHAWTDKKLTRKDRDALLWLMEELIQFGRLYSCENQNEQLTNLLA
jgi:hypothetical protein